MRNHRTYDPALELGLWVRKQRAAKEQGTLSEERLRILLELGFEFGEEANITEEWELRFDLLMELLFMRVSPFSLAQQARHVRLMPWSLLQFRGWFRWQCPADVKEATEVIPPGTALVPFWLWI